MEDKMFQKSNSFRFITTLGVTLSSVIFIFSLASKANAQFQTYPIPSQIEMRLSAISGAGSIITAGNPCSPALPASFAGTLNIINCNIASTPSAISLTIANSFSSCYIDININFPNEMWISGTCTYDPVSQRLILVG